MPLGLAKRMQLRSANFRQILSPNTFLNEKSPLRSRILSANPKIMHRPRSYSPLYLDTRNMSRDDSQFVRENKMPTQNANAQRLLPAAMLEHWPQV